jgi:hypothetical protein
MKTLIRFGLLSTLLLGSLGCGAESSEKAAESAPVRAGGLRVKPADSPYAPARARLVIPSGTLLKVSLTGTLDTGTSSAGERFWASLSEPVVIDGKMVLQEGSLLRGRVVAVEAADRVKGVASIQLALISIVQGDRMVAITTAAFTTTADPSKTSGAVTATKGKEIHYGPETTLDFSLADSVQM